MRKSSQFLSENLLVTISLSFIAGIVICRQLRYPIKALDYLYPLLLLFLFAACLFYFTKKNQLLIWLLLLISIGIGFQHNRLAMQTPASSSHIVNRITGKTEIILSGTLMEMVTFNGLYSRILIQAKSIRLESSSRLLPTKGKIVLSFKGKWPEKYTVGDLLAIRCTVQRPNSTRTPGVFDYAQYLATQDIWITGFVRSHILINRLNQVEKSYLKLRFLPERVRSRIAQHIDKSLAADSAAIFRAILLGDRSSISNSTLESFQGSGTMHILAISGLHITVISAICFYLTYWVLSRFEFLLLRCTLQKWVVCFCLPFLVGYSLITGLNAPVTRAILMSCIIIGALLTNRKKSPAPLIALAALLILLANPLQLYTASFQLSFMAIISIVYILPTLKTLLYREPQATQQELSVMAKFWHWFLAAVFVSCVATLGTAPLLLIHYNRISILGPISNLVIEPLICFWSLPFGIISIPFTFLSPEISSLLLRTGSVGIVLATKAATFFNSLPFSSVRLPSPPLWLIVLYYLALALTVSQKFRRPRWFFPPLTVLCLSILLMLYQDKCIRIRPDTFQVTFLDIGQGSAALVEYPEGQRIIIDGGGASIGSQNVGERIIAPYLWKKGIHSIDAIVITHPDADHYNGLEFIIKHFSPGILWVRDQLGHDKNYRQLISLTEAHRVKIVVPQAGQHMHLPRADITCVENLMANLGQNPAYSSGNAQNKGIVIKTIYKNFTTLFPGDIDTFAEKQLIKNKYNLRADIMLSPHHGSITSNSREFLAAVSPKHLVVSAAGYAKSRFPHPGLKYDCNAHGISLLSTASQGTIVIKSTGEGYSVFKTEKFEDNMFTPHTEVLMGTFR